MATAVISGSGTSTLNRSISDEERRWMVIGICLNKVLTPTLRAVLRVEIPKWHQTLVKPPIEIDQQTSVKFEKYLPPSAIKLNYDNINNNAVHKSTKSYDYAVKDALSLAKLFVKPFMAAFSGFDHTMDTSAALAITCEAQPFIVCGAAVRAKKVRSDVRNEWAHCDFSHWTKPRFVTALNDIESLVRTLNLSAAEEKNVLDEIDKWRNNGIKLCIGNPVDSELLHLIQTEVGNLQESVTLCNEDAKADKERLLHSLKTFQTSLDMEIHDLKHRQTLTEENVDRLKLEQLTLHNQCVTAIQDIESKVNKFAPTSDDIPYVFHSPRKNPWFGGRLSELQDLSNLLPLNDTSQPKVNIAAVCGLGGVGKTSLATEFAQQRKNFYTGGVYWFSGEDDSTFESSVYDVATRLRTQTDLFDLTFSATLAKISQNNNPWLIVLDNMDQLSLSPNIIKLVSGPWQHHASGHILITTRRKPAAFAQDIRGFDEECCLSLQCFTVEEGKKFIFRRISNVNEEEMNEVAEELVQQLGGLPLALEQAGAYIKSLPCTISQYLELYEKQRLRLLNRQKAASVSVYDSHERLAVRTTWHLNFEHIKHSVDDGKAATKFLYASAFLNPNEIQKDIINVGEPPIEDKEFNECVKTTLGRQQVLKLLTDFSLFKETESSNLNVHHLVQEVILESLNADEEIQSINDAIRMLLYAFQNCFSPNELLLNEKQERPSIICGDRTRFYHWHKLCLHSCDLVRHLKRILNQPNVNCTMIFQPETARIAYEYAVHLSANSKHDEAKGLAIFANDIFYLSNPQVLARSFLPHTIPLPELIRRHIQYSCNTPATTEKDDVKVPKPSVTSEQLENMRMKGNKLFKTGFYNDALKIYSDAIDLSRNTDFFDIRFLSNRASVYLKLGQFDEALHDSEDYILQHPKCWKGYARKALALAELKDMQGACVAASMAYYYKRTVFCDFEPFKEKFGSSLEMRITVCRDTLDLSKALCIAKIMDSCNIPSADACKDLSVIILESGDYFLSKRTIDSDLFCSYGRTRTLTIKNCILVGGDREGECSITIDDSHDIWFAKVFIAYKISFRSRFSNCLFLPGSIVKLTHCSFESSNDTYTSFFCQGKLKADFCTFHSCTMGGLLVVGDAEIKNAEFYGNAVALEVREGGRLVVQNSRMYGNSQGLLIGPHVRECSVEDCELYDNEWGGIVVTNCAADIVIKGNRSFDNTSNGISVIQSSKVSILENEILSNNDWGITIRNSNAIVKKNKIQNNQCGGILTEFTWSLVEKPVIEYNHISFNSGPGIYDDGLPTECKENKLEDNKAERNQLATQFAEDKLCYYCRKLKMNAKKCSACFVAQYCGRQCQKNDWNKHKDICHRLLSDGTVLLNYVQKPVPTIYISPTETQIADHDHDGPIPFRINERAEGLLPVGRKYCQPPNTTTRFIVKMSAGISAMSFEGNEDFDPSIVRLYDRSRTIDGKLTGAEQIHNLVRKLGAIGQLKAAWKKLFMWVKGPENGKLRVFINEFPAYQKW